MKYWQLSLMFNIAPFLLLVLLLAFRAIGKFGYTISSQETTFFLVVALASFITSLVFLIKSLARKEKYVVGALIPFILTVIGVGYIIYGVLYWS